MIDLSFFKSDLSSSADFAIKIGNRLKNHSVRYLPRHHRFVITVPPCQSIDQVYKFLEGAKPWFEQQVQNFSPYQFPKTITLLDKSYTLTYKTTQRAHVWCEDGILIVSAPLGEHHTTLVKWLNAFAQRFFKSLAYDFAHQLHLNVHQVRIKDTVSQWGSCTPGGILTFSWRLLFAPKEVARYVCAHEVSHLREMNHSRAFWAVVKEIFPHYHDQHHWLKKHGNKLLALRFGEPGS